MNDEAKEAPPSSPDELDRLSREIYALLRGKQSREGLAVLTDLIARCYVHQEGAAPERARDGRARFIDSHVRILGRIIDREIELSFEKRERAKEKLA